jgi:hypothetical protein
LLEIGANRHQTEDIVDPSRPLHCRAGRVDHRGVPMLQELAKAERVASGCDGVVGQEVAVFLKCCHGLI